MYSSLRHLLWCGGILKSILFLQVVMGYSHSLVIARQDTEQEQEKLKKLPEYNPRTIWRAHQQWHLNPFHRAEEQPCDQQEYLTCSVATSHGIVLVGWLSWGERCSRVWRLSTHLDSQQTPQQFGHSNQRRWDWRLTDALDGPALTMNGQDIFTSQWACNGLF